MEVFNPCVSLRYQLSLPKFCRSLIYINTLYDLRSDTMKFFNIRTLKKTTKLLSEVLRLMSIMKKIAELYDSLI